MPGKELSQHEAPTQAFHERGYQAFAEKSQDERIKELVRMGILTEERELSPRYGGKEMGRGLREGQSTSMQ